MSPLCPHSSARLLIHGTEDARVVVGLLGSVLLLVHALVSDRPRRQPPSPTGVRIDDLQGLQHFASDDAGSLIDLRLPAGTYHVTVRLGKLQRRYTVALERGTAFDLYLRPSAQPH